MQGTEGARGDGVADWVAPPWNQPCLPDVAVWVVIPLCVAFRTTTAAFAETTLLGPPHILSPSLMHVGNILAPH